jgi:hypothetical protein
MKAALFAFALPLFAANSAGAMPLAPFAPTSPPITQVQMRCDVNSCIDQRTGVYTESTCDYRGCRPSSGPRGRIGGYGQDYRYSRGRDYDDGYYRRRDYGYYGRRGYEDGYRVNTR